jgi:hypothetical protein
MKIAKKRDYEPEVHHNLMTHPLLSVVILYAELSWHLNILNYKIGIILVAG